jgi:hypothetical protein
MPARTLLAKVEKTVLGCKPAKDSHSADGKFQLKPLIVYHSQNPWALKKKVRTYCHLETKMAGNLFLD